MEKGIEFEVIGIAEAIKRNRFVVPPNQREYSWLKDVQVSDLLQDISNSLRNPEVPYFIGTIVLTVGKDGMLEIADGQQRLATTTMILASIRDWFRSKGDTMIVQSIENDFLFTIDRKERERIPKLTLNLDDNEYFKNLILDPAHARVSQTQMRRSHKLIYQASLAIQSYINGLEKQYGVEYIKEHLNDWIDYLSKNVNIVKLVVSNSENAFKMFETLNDRGLKTSQVDLVKNHIFKVSDNRLPEAQRLWSSMRGAVETIAEEDDVMIDFLRDACCIISGSTTKKEIMTRVKEKTQSKLESIRMLTLFEELSKDFAAILNPDHQKWNNYDPDIRKSIQAINLFGVTQIRPLMLAVSKYFNPHNAAIAFRKFVSWSVRFLIMNIRGGRLDEGYARLAHKIYNQEIKNAEQLKIESEKTVVSDGEFKTAFETAKVGVSKLGRYYLRALENTARGESDPELIPNDGSVINLEHIMPESINNDWKHLQRHDVESHLSRIGNLALLQAVKNNKVGNQGFDEKKKLYKDSAFLLTAQVADLEQWDTTEIDKRQKYMAELAVQTWQL